MDTKENVMAASVYATPPPELSSEDTALSDVSNSSHISSSSSQHSKATKRNITSMLLSGNEDITNSYISTGQTTIKSTSPSRPSSMSSNSPIDPSIDQSKKRRKQTTPLRISGGIAKKLHTDKGTENLQNAQDINAPLDTTNDCKSFLQQTPNSSSENKIAIEVDHEHFDNDKVQNEQIQTKVNDVTCSSANEIIINKNSKENCDKSKEQSLQICLDIIKDNAYVENSNSTINTDISNIPVEEKNSKNTNINSSKLTDVEKTFDLNTLKNETESVKENNSKKLIRDPETYFDKRSLTNLGNIDYCEQCGEKFESELKLHVHILQSHTLPKVHVIPKFSNQEISQKNFTEKNEADAIKSFDSVQIKLENSDSDSDSENHISKNNNHNKNYQQMSSLHENNENGNQNITPARPDEWLSSMSTLGFPFPPEAAAAFSASSYLSQLPLLGVPPVGTYNPVEGLSRPPLRIFNPEAYCDLCNKEFCNKYFLKTHKANKHGIYDPVTSSNDNPATASNQFNQISQVLQMQFHQQQQQYEQHKQFQQQQQAQSSIDISTKQQQQQHLALQQTQSQSTTQTSNLQPSPHSLLQTEITVFCDICNKRFTNIFAMKRHRSKAHEIPQESTSPTSISTVPKLSNNNCNNNNSNNNSSSNNTSNLIKLDTVNKQTAVQQNQPLSALSQNQSQQNQKQNSKSNTGASIENDVSSTNINVQQENQQNIFRLPEGFKEDYSLEQEEVSFTPQPRKLSPSSAQQAKEANFSFDKLKRLGVINPEAFCDLCCKEYCNKYFLRTHKLKRHGIFIPIDDIGSSLTNPIGRVSVNDNMENKGPDKNLLTHPIWPPFVQQMQQQMQQMQMHIHQAAPLNLMMAAAAAGVTPNTTDKIQRRPSQDSEDGSNLNLNDGTSFKKIRLDNFAGRSNNVKLHESQNKPTSFMNEITKKRIDSKESSSIAAEIFDKNLDISENLSQLMQEGFVGAAAAAAIASSQESDAVGLDLQKLQSMILQLNDLNGQNSIICNLCGKEMENQFHLQAHIATEHIGSTNTSIDESNQLRNQIEAGLLPFKSQFGISSQMSSPTNSNSTEICKQCDREFPGLLELKQHIIDYHGLMLNSPIREDFMTPERSIPGGGSLTAPSTPNQLDRKPLYTVTPTSSYCEICNKELCNKYFMKTHMQRMHGIEIENGSQIGGVVCNICNKELCSKYFLRVHKTNSHGIVDEGSPTPGPLPGKFDEATKSLFDAFDSKSGDLSDLGARYFTHYTEVCPLCNRRFRSSKWLRAHLMSDHGKVGVEKLQELAQSMIFSKPDSPPHLKIPNGNGINSDGGNNVGSNTSANRLLISGLNSLDPNILKKSSPFPNLFTKSANSNEEPPISPNSANPVTGFQEYQCSICPFTTPYYAFLFIHERSHTMLNPNSAEQKNVENPEKEDENASETIEEKNEKEKKEKPKIIEEKSESYPTNNIKLLETKQDETTLPIIPKLEILEKSDSLNIEKTSYESKFSSIQSDPKEPNPISNSNFSNLLISDKSSISRSLSETNISNIIESSEKHKQYLLESKLESRKTKNIETLAENTDNTKIPNINVLTNLAKLLNRPASYAIPEEFDTNNVELMQSFLIEETPSKNLSKIETDDEKNKVDEIDMSNKQKNESRFVPAVIYLPVKKRILSPITISFTLTPA